MKRFLLLSIGVLVSGVLGLQLGQITLAVQSSEDLLGTVFSDAELEQSDAKDPKELNNLASNEEVPFQNLYLFMFQNVTKGPSEAALDELQTRLKEKRKHDYSIDELRSIVVEGSLEPIIQKLQSVAGQISADPNAVNENETTLAEQEKECKDFIAANSFTPSIQNFYTWYCSEYVMNDEITQDDSLAAAPQKNILDEYNYLVDLYQNELDLQREYRKHSYESIAQEMFFNGDLGDSANIDILHDLDLAHEVIFGTDITYPDRSGATDVDLASLPSEIEDANSEVPAETNLAGINSSVTLSSESISPYTCFDDEALHTALDTFNSTDTGATQLTLPTSSIVYPSAGSESASESETPQQAVDDALHNLDGFISDLQGPQGDWTRSLPCSDIFCITVNLVSDTEDPTTNYSETDNCIVCHLNYINKRMGQTLDKSLVANKASQNWFEDATCKEAGSQVDLDFNIYTIAMPIELDPGDDIDEVPSKEIDDLKNTLLSIGALSKSSTTQFNKTMSDLACESIFNLDEVAGSPVTLDTAQSACVEAAAAIQSQVDETVEKIKFQAAIGNGDTLYQQAAGELYSMLLVFRNIQDGLQKTYVTGDAPLSTLLKKHYCGEN